MKIKKYIQSNIGFIVILILTTILAFSPKVKGVMMRGLIKTGLFEPDVSDLKPKEVKPEETNAAPLVPSARFTGENGKAIDLAELKGKVIFLNFWATWCPPCIAEMPSVNELYKRFKDNKSVVFVLVDADGKMKSAQAFMKKHKHELPVYVPAGQIPGQLFRGSLPTTIIVNKKGEIVFGHEGMADYNSDQVIKFMNDLANE